MSFSEDLLDHAIKLLGKTGDQDTSSADLRRAVSAAYYALLHHLAQATVNQIAPNVEPREAHRIQRWLDHAEIKKVCSRFIPAKLERPLSELIGATTSNDLRSVAFSFVRLQSARHSADYDLAYVLPREDAVEFVKMPARAFIAWNRIAQTSEANIFLLSLLLWNNWERDRPA